MAKRPKISVALATHNEEANIGRCLQAVRDWVDEVVVVDGSSTDATRTIAKKFGVRVLVRENPPIFHINKQIALEKCRGDWILQLDADEEVTHKLAEEIKKVISLSESEIETYQQSLPEKRLLLRHQRLLEKRDGEIGSQEGKYAGFFTPRLNYFLGKPLRYGGVYPDGVIRLVKKGHARFPCKSVHEQIEVKGKVGWLQNPLFHWADPDLKRYLKRNSQYIDLMAVGFEKQKVGKNPWQFFRFFKIKPAHWFFSTLLRHKGILDGWRGVVFSFFSYLRFPRAYWRYLTGHSFFDNHLQGEAK